jgi:uncharacterized membrane protein
VYYNYNYIFVSITNLLNIYIFVSITNLLNIYCGRCNFMQRHLVQLIFTTTQKTNVIQEVYRTCRDVYELIREKQ